MKETARLSLSAFAELGRRAHGQLLETPVLWLRLKEGLGL